MFVVVGIANNNFNFTYMNSSLINRISMIVVVSVLFLGVGSFMMPIQAQSAGPMITSSETTHYTATVSWTPRLESSVVGYEVRYRVEGSEGAFSTSNTTVTASTASATVSITGLEAQTSYELDVRSVYTNDRFSSWRNLTTVTTATLPPVPGLSSLSTTSDSISLHWNRSTDPTIAGYEVRYRVEGSESAYTTSNVSVELTATVAIVSITNLEAQTIYEIQIRTLFTGEDSSSGLWLDFTTIETLSATTSGVPMFDNGTKIEFSLPENSSLGTRVGHPLTVSDSDNNSFYYSLSGQGAQYFDIDHATGQILVKKGVTYNYEARNHYEFEVYVTDRVPDNSVDDSIRVNVVLENVDEFRRLGLSTSLPEVSDQIQAVLADPDGGEVEQRWVWKRYYANGTSDVIARQNGGNRSFYTPQRKDIGHLLLVEVFYDDAQGPNKAVSFRFVNPVIGI